MRPALLAGTWILVALAAGAAGYIRPSEVFMPPGKQLALLPDGAMVGVIEAALPGLDSAEACAEACSAALRNGTACDFNVFCSRSGGCSTQAYGAMEQGECLLLSRNCTLPAKREAAQGVVSGFPIHNFPGAVLEAFPTFLTQAIVGADFPCPTSEVKGICAFTKETNALFNCYRMRDICVAVTVFANGTNGCSDKPLAVLKTEVPTNANSFVSSDVYTVALTEAQRALRTLFMFADQAELDLPSDEEIKATGADAPDSLAYKGCQIGYNFLYHGDIVATVDGMSSAKACCRACTAHNVQVGRRNCTVFNYCSRPGGCTFTHQQDESKSVTLQQGQCQLRYQPLATSITSLPPSLLASGADVPFEAGAPNALWAPEVPGFRRFPGETIALTGAFACKGSLRPETGECVLAGTLQESADYCMRTEECATFSYRPGPQANSTNGTQGGSSPVPMVSSFKGHSDAPDQVVFPTAVLYYKESAAGAAAGSSASSSGTPSGAPEDGSSSGLSAGAIAGIAVGAAVGAAAAAGCIWLLLQQRQRRRQQSPGKTTNEAGRSSSKLGNGDSWGSPGALPRYSPGSAAPDSNSGSRQLSTSGPASGEAIPELVHHAAAHEAALMARGAISPQGSGQWDDSQLLPPHLREWVVDASQVNYLERPDGKLWQIGSGASSKVYRVEYRGEMLAAKEVELGASQSLRETFVTEARMLHQLRHPNVVGFAGVTFHGSKGVVLMELCEGRDLHSALQLTLAGSQKRLFAWERRGKRVALDVAKAVNFLHQNNVVHMDIKSPNILLTASGTAKLADCGFSKTKHDSVLSSVSSVGTFAWAAPELLLGSERPTAAIDVYSYGVVLHELITGDQPQRGRLRMPRDDECPEGVRALMLECLQQQPSARPTALQVLTRLRALVEGVTSTGSPKAVGSPKAGDSAADAAGTAGVAGEAATGSGPPAAPAPLQQAPSMSIQLRPTPPSPFAS